MNRKKKDICGNQKEINIQRSIVIISPEWQSLKGNDCHIRIYAIETIAPVLVSQLGFLALFTSKWDILYLSVALQGSVSLEWKSSLQRRPGTIQLGTTLKKYVLVIDNWIKTWTVS